MNKIIMVTAIIIALIVLPVPVYAADKWTPPAGFKVATIEVTDIYSDFDIDCLERAVMAEGGNQDDETQKLIALVILNRTKSKKYPDTIDEVVKQKGKNGVYQFSIVPSGMYKKAKPTDKVKQNCQDAMWSFLNEMKEVPDALMYFNAIDFFSWNTVIDYTKSDDVYFSCLKDQYM